MPPPSAWFQAQLAGNAGREAMAYLERRGRRPGDHPRLRARLCAQRGAGRCARRSRAQGFGDAELIAAGLVKADEGGEPFAHFRHRLMFPIADERGRIVGFGGRALGDARAKYLNTPETEIFHKGELLYNLHRAKGPAREQRALVLAEGYMDVIALAQAGIAHAVAPLGTAVTERQLASLWRMAEAPVVCLDGDRAGLAAAMRAAERALPVMRGGQTLRFAILPDGEDPDSYLRRHGAEALASVLSKAHTLSQMIWRLETQGRRFETPEAARGAQPAAARRWRGSPAIPICGRACWTSSGSCRTSRRRAPSSVVGEIARARPRPGMAWVRPASRRESRGARRIGEAAILLPLLLHPEWLRGPRGGAGAAAVPRSATSNGCARKSSHGSARRPALTRMHSRATSSDTV